MSVNLCNQTLKLYQNEHNDELIVISLFSSCPQVTVASKFLTFQEFVRDSADLYLSLRYPPPVFICGTPCGFVGHVDCKNEDVSKVLWDKNGGCFEEPTHGKVPTQVLAVTATFSLLHTLLSHNI